MIEGHSNGSSVGNQQAVRSPLLLPGDDGADAGPAPAGEDFVPDWRDLPASTFDLEPDEAQQAGTGRVMAVLEESGPMAPTAPQLMSGEVAPPVAAGRRRSPGGLIAGIALAAGIVAGGLLWPKPAPRPAPVPRVVNPAVQQGLPDPALTPGETASVLTDTPVPDETERAVLAAYGIDPAQRKYVVCRLIPRALGGTNGARNLFPTTPWFAELKSRLDGHLSRQVREGKLTEQEARQALTDNWIRAAHANYIRNYGLGEEEKARQKEDALPW